MHSFLHYVIMEVRIKRLCNSHFCMNIRYSTVLRVWYYFWIFIGIVLFIFFTANVPCIGEASTRCSGASFHNWNFIYLMYLLAFFYIYVAYKEYKKEPMPFKKSLTVYFPLLIGSLILFFLSPFVTVIGVMAFLAIITLKYRFKNEPISQYADYKPFHFSWRGDKNFDKNFILFFWVTFIFIGEQFPVLTQYLLQGTPTDAPGAKSSFVDNLSPSGIFSSLEIAGVYAILSVLFWLAYRYLNWIIVMVIGGAIGFGLELLFFNHSAANGGTGNGADLGKNFLGAALFFYFIWAALVILPFLIYKGIFKKWQKKGIVIGTIAFLVINILSLSLFAYEKYVIKNVYLGQKCPPQCQGTLKPGQSIPETSPIPESYAFPFYTQSDIRSMGVFDNSGKSPDKEKSDGFDFYPSGNDLKVRSISNGLVSENDLVRELNGNWSVHFVVQANNGDTFIYNFETYSQLQSDAQSDFSNIHVKANQTIKEGDYIGSLHKTNTNSRLHFSVMRGQKAICPANLYDQNTQKILLNLLHASHPGWELCY